MDICLGAGIAGLGAWYRNRELELFEATSEAGGLCGNFCIDAREETSGYFLFDKAVHLSFTKDSIVRELFDCTEYFDHRPVPYSWFHNCWLKHPAQNNLYPLPVKDRVEALKGVMTRVVKPNEENFEDWSRNRYGEWLYESMFRPYNEKYWCLPLNELEIGWIGKRIYQPTLDEILYGSYTDETPNTYYAPEMRYPIRGGYYAFLSDLAENAAKCGRLHTGKRVIGISCDKKQVTFSDGSVVSYNRCLSSIPLPEMVRMTDGIPLVLREKAEKLEATGVVLVSIGLRKPKVSEKMWFYIYDTDILAARAYLPSVKSSYNVPEGCSSIQFEIYFNRKDKIPEKETCVENCNYALRKMGLAEQQDILFVDYRVLPYGNVIFKMGTEKIALELTEWFQNVGIVPIGRFGEWKYFWSDQAFLSGYYALNK